MPLLVGCGVPIKFASFSGEKRRGPKRVAVRVKSITIAPAAFFASLAIGEWDP